jgi:hypothetical protein
MNANLLTIDAARQRVAELVAMKRARPNWREESVALAMRTTRGDLYSNHPSLRRLRTLDRGYLDVAGQTPLRDRFPSLAQLGFAETINLELNDDDVLDQVGPESDFDPLNSIPFASVRYESVWFSLLCIPALPLTHWPVVQCEPSGTENVVPIAIDVQHFMHDWICRDGRYCLSPLKDVDDAVADAVIAVASEAFACDPRLARLARRLDLENAEPPFELRPTVPEEVLAPLSEWCVLPPQ